ncbi:hypothetical protein DACRYDRAFT_20945 [Dacryopinax primogenitus]|uniref:BTB domain-containing protein n=1 Tax=Dacryopinax primogenitus (strain DJM 731) TaxID=1858805 RepID=M5GFT1_DACPD|nr:uncharacterized protein DACRYDRAFT_20945 [Dacryopinax primogenitus]EJU04403.1 hypothetical protein DACRYDRAFT_20945 [Dacryopinax primogenitus]
MGVFPPPHHSRRSISSPSWNVEDSGSGTEDMYEHVQRSESGLDEGEEIEVDPTFRRDNEWPGTVRINVENTTFWAHKDVLIFASPFFAAALSGNWAETGRPASLSSSIITVTRSSTPPPLPSPSHGPIPESVSPTPDSPEPSPGMFPADLEAEQESDGATDPQPDPRSSPPPQTTLHFLSPSQCKECASPLPDSATPGNSSGEDEDPAEAGAEADPSVHRAASLRALSSGPPRRSTMEEKRASKGKRNVRVSWDGRAGRRPRPVTRMSGCAEAVIDLKEERASAFHDFLKFVYPHLECTITWNNVENLMHLSQKLISPNLQSACLSFLLSHAAGKPIKALRIAELYEEEELYREASRFVLDNLGGWPDSELRTLSRDTLLKLEKRRTWFLERLLKLGVTPIAKDYTCCSSCPDPTTCARHLEEKWRQGYLSLLRFGPPQPSMVFRYLRQLELSPPLTLTHLSCQTCAKTYISTLFDRMFSLGVRGSGTDTTPLGARVGVASGIAGPRRHFLYCALRGEREWKPASTRGEVYFR